MTAEHILWTGQLGCYDAEGREITCPGTGQDGVHSPGMMWPEPRFLEIAEGLVLDRATDLIWSDVSLFSYPMTWQESLDAVRQMNREGRLGRTDWRLPNRRELRSLISHGNRNPALPPGHLFGNVFLGWYWTSTSYAREQAYAWTVHLEGGRMFYGKKESDNLVWPVCGNSQILPRSGQSGCYDRQGREISCSGTGQDGELAKGVAWPSPRFVQKGSVARDALTGLTWYAAGDLDPAPSNWVEALAAVQDLALTSGCSWRLPTINELESLVDASRHSPALPAGHSFYASGEGYWSSTTSFFEPSWAYVLYLQKGAVGVGYKKNREFSIWPVRG